MRQSLIKVVFLAAVGLTLAANVADAQVYHTPGGSLVVPPPPRPAPPALTVPTVPQMASPPRFELGNTSPSLIQQNQPPNLDLKSHTRRKSFSDRVTRCLQEGAALGLGPGERSAYSRSCAQR